jgi:SAM-dependent methyltransferase
MTPRPPPAAGATAGPHSRTDPPRDTWLDRWLPLLVARAAARPVLEIGCGPGADTQVLAAAGLAVMAFDLSADAVAQARARVPSATVRVQDVRDPFPVEAQGTGVVVASLSLHYFGWAETEALFGRVWQTLWPGGVLLCRLNSTEDVHFGAAAPEEIEPHYRLVDGQPKRFFDRASVDRILAHGWEPLSVQHTWTDKYGPPKAMWELVCARQAA